MSNGLRSPHETVSSYLFLSNPSFPHCERKILGKLPSGSDFLCYLSEIKELMNPKVKIGLGLPTLG